MVPTNYEGCINYVFGDGRQPVKSGWRDGTRMNA